MSNQKRFDPELFRINDALAKKAVANIIDKRKFKIVENPKRYGVDLLVYQKGVHVLNIETEVKRVWKNKTFEYDNVQFPERKEKFCKLGIPTIFVMWNADQTQYLVVKDKDFLKSPKVEVPNRYVYKGEFFYQIPLTKVVFNGITKVIKEIVK